MSLMVMKVFCNKQKPKIIQYKKYTGFSNEAFIHELESALARFSQISFGTFKSTVEISLEAEKVNSENMEIAETFNQFFVNIVPNLKVLPKENYENDNEPILNYINKFKNHPSIKVIKSNQKENQTFTFNYVSYEEVFNEIRELQTTKPTQQNDIPTKILKKNSDVFARYFHKNINFCIENSILPSDLKIANVTPAFQ